MKDKSLLVAISVVGIVLLLAMVGIFALEVAADDTSDTYMILRLNAAGYDFDCLDTLPFSDERQMQWDSTSGFSELTEYPLLVAQVVQVAYCHVDNIYLDRTSGEHFRWGFSQRVTDEHDNHRHVTRGAYWVSYDGSS